METQDAKAQRHDEIDKEQLFATLQLRVYASNQDSMVSD